MPVVVPWGIGRCCCAGDMGACECGVAGNEVPLPWALVGEKKLCPSCSDFWGFEKQLELVVKSAAPPQPFRALAPHRYPAQRPDWLLS